MSIRLALFVAAVSGFVALSYEILWFRLFSFVTQGAPVAFGALLGAYLFGIAGGAYGSRAYCESGDGRRGSAGRALGFFLFLANLAAFAVAPLMGRMVTALPEAVSLVPVGVAAALLGAVLPLTSHLAIAPDDHAGARLSHLYAANIAGSCLGSLATGFVAMDLWGTRAIAVGLACVGFVLAGVVVWALERDGAWRRGGLVAISASVVLAIALAPRLFDQLYERLLYGAAFTPETRFAESVENKSGVIHVTRDGKVFGGGAYDGVFNTSLVPDRNWVVRAYAVGALRPKAARVLMIGLSSGSWAKILASAPGLERLTVVEINPGYLELIARHPEVASVLHDPKVDIAIDDGRRWLEAHDDARFDAVVMNMTWHWRAHATNLLSREFLELVHRHLAPGGLYYFNTTWSLDACRTAMAAFPHALRVKNFVAVSDAPLSIDLGTWRELLAGYRLDGRHAVDRRTDEGARAFEALVASLREGGPEADVEGERSLARSCQAGEVITDDNMLSEWRQLSHHEKP